MTLYQQVLRIQPRHLAALKCFGILAFTAGAVEKGLEYMQTATRVDPRDSEAWSNYGNALRELQRNRESADACQRAISLDPQNGTAHSNLAAALRCLGRPGESLRHAQIAVKLIPEVAEAHINLASGHQNMGETSDALTSLQVAARVNPGHVATRQNLLFTALYSDELSDREITEMHKDFGKLFPAVPKPPKRQKCKRIGFVSGDLRKHPVGRFMSNLMPHFDRTEHEIYLYANLHDPDDVSQVLESNCNKWSLVAGLDDAALADRIRADEIDVLIDLSGHTALNRLTMFAHRPCAVQATWLGYSSTTGLPAMDFFIGDEVTNPILADDLYTERVARLGGPFLCDQELTSVPDAIPHPEIIFASFNNTAKFSPTCIELWSRVLKAVPGSKLIMKYGTIDDPIVQSSLAARFAQHGISRERIEFLGFQSLEDHRAFFQKVDVCLDTAPYTGATTTMDSLRGGTPVVTLAGGRYSSRMSASILTHAGLSQCVANTADEFVAIARELAESIDKRAEIRNHLKTALPGSKLFDAKAFTKDFQDLCNAMHSQS